jgi:hypothetical protein
MAGAHQHVKDNYEKYKEYIKCFGLADTKSNIFFSILLFFFHTVKKKKINVIFFNFYKSWVMIIFFPTWVEFSY